MLSSGPISNSRSRSSSVQSKGTSCSPARLWRNHHRSTLTRCLRIPATLVGVGPRRRVASSHDSPVHLRTTVARFSSLALVLP